MFRALIAGVLFCPLMAPVAVAQWMTGEDENAFEKTKSRWVFSVSDGGNVLGFRCNGPDVDEASMIFVTTERLSPSDAKTMNILKPTLAIIVDDGERVDLQAAVDTVEIGGGDRLRIVATGEQAQQIAEKIAAAKRRVSAAIVLGRKTFHPTNIGARGSRGPIELAFKACGLIRKAS